MEYSLGVGGREGVGGRVSAGRRVVRFCNVGRSTGRYMLPGTDLVGTVRRFRADLGVEGRD